MSDALDRLEKALNDTIGLLRHHDGAIDSLESDADDFRSRLDALEGPPGSAPHDLSTLADLDRALRNLQKNVQPDPATQLLYDELRLLFGSVVGRLRAVEVKVAHPLIVGAFPDHAPGPVIDAEFPDPAVDGTEIAHHKATILRLEQRIAELTKLTSFAQALFARITQGGGDHRDLAHVGELVIADGSGKVDLVARGGMFDIEVPALGKQHGIEIRIVGAER